MILLAIDYGTKRVGLAKGDTESCIARPFSILDNKSEDYVISELKKIIKEEWIDLILIGRPTNTDGRSTEQTTYTELFIEKFKNLGIEKLKIEVIDERFSSRQAKTMTSQKKDRIDDIAATVFLQDFIDKMVRNK